MALWRSKQKLCVHQNSSLYSKTAACLKGSWQCQTSALPRLVFPIPSATQSHTGTEANHPTRFPLSTTTYSTAGKDGINHLPSQQLSAQSQGLTLLTPSLQQSDNTPMMQSSAHAAQIAALLAPSGLVRSFSAQLFGGFILFFSLFCWATGLLQVWSFAAVSLFKILPNVTSSIVCHR